MLKKQKRSKCIEMSRKLMKNEPKSAITVQKIVTGAEELALDCIINSWPLMK